MTEAEARAQRIAKRRGQAATPEDFFARWQAKKAREKARVWPAHIAAEFAQAASKATFGHVAAKPDLEK